MTVVLLVVALTLCVALPLAAIANWLVGRVGGETAFFAGLTGAIALWVIAATALAQIDRLTRTAGWVMVLAIGAASIAAIRLAVLKTRQARSDSAEEQPRRSRRMRRDDRRRSVRSGALVTVGLVGAAAPTALVITTRLDSLPGSTPWFYWLGARTTAIAEGLPKEAFEWGKTVAGFDEHAGFSSATGLLMTLTDSTDSLAVAQLSRFLTALFAAAGAYYLARAWGAGRLVSVAGVYAFFSIAVFSLKLESFRPEAFAYGLMLLIPALTKRACDESSTPLFAISIVAFGALSQIHGIAAAVSGIMVVATLGVHVVLPREATRTFMRRLGSVAVILALLATSYLAAGRLLGSGATSAATLDDTPSLSTTGADPSWAFRELTIGNPNDPGEDAPSAASLFRRSMLSGFRTVSGEISLIIAGAVALGLLLAARSTARARRVGLFIGATLLGVIAVSLIFAWGWDTYVPRRTGFQRILQLWYVLVPLGGAVLVSSLERSKRWIVGAWCVACLALWVSVVPDVWASRTTQPSSATIEALDDLELPAEAVVLTNGYTEGFVRATVGADGLLEGRAPYLEADLLDRANTIMLDTIHYFSRPLHAPFPFEKYGVDYVLVATEPYAFAKPSNYATDISALDLSPELERVDEGESFILYEVVSAS